MLKPLGFSFLFCSIDSMGSDQDGVPSKVSDSGVGGLESGEDSWISDTEVSNILRIVSFRGKKRSEIL